MEPQARPAWPGLLALTAPAVVHRVHQALKGPRVLQELTAPRELPVHLAQQVHKEWQGPEVRPEPQELLAQLGPLGRRARTALQAPQD